MSTVTFVVPEVKKRSDSGKALLCTIDGVDTWVPISQLDDDSEVYDVGHSGKLVVSEWWANKAGLL